ncbi:MAG TPA: SLBB domain-containing protein [Nitrospiraceae bacterium]|jgi:polysaccharide export outer membrane protein|nr:SLBB domain-containing protein [Nitrospiraceae bacterium]
MRHGEVKWLARPRPVCAAMAWLLSALLIIPPNLMAQGSGNLQTGSPLPFGLSPAAVLQPAPGQPILTNPTALQPIVPAQSPCPALPTPQPEPVGQIPALHELWPVDPTTVLPLSVEERMRQEREAKQPPDRGPDTRSPGAPNAPAPPMMSPGASGAQAVAEVAAQKREREAFSATRRDVHPHNNFTVEEAFARFSVLQDVKSRLTQFGYNFFDLQSTTFAPVQDVPVGPDYVVGPQDSLAVHIWNVPDPTFNRSYIAQVERDGTLVIPQVGAIPVGGLTFSQAEQAIRTRLTSLLKRFDLHVAMARLRTMKVFVVGEVVRPGAYELSTLATVTQSLYAACGPSRSGSLRQVRVVRDGTTVAELDFYQFLLHGDRSQDQRLRPGDVVVVPPLGAVVAVSGAVKRPAIYEIKPGTTLSDALTLAGGLGPFATRERCHIFRADPVRGRVLIDVPLAGFSEARSGEARPKGDQAPRTNLILQDGDFVVVPPLPTRATNVASLAGAVKSPGPFEFRPGMRLADVLVPELLLPEADRSRAEIVRTHPVTFETTVIPFSPQALFEGREAENHPLQQWDQIAINSRLRPPSLVLVEGEVVRPGHYTLQTGERLSSVLKRAGGLTPKAFPQGIVLLRESVKRRQEAELQRFIASERERLTAQSAAVAAGAVGVSGSGGVITSAEQQTLAIRLQQLEALAGRAELGRVVVRLESIEQLEGSPDDIVLEDRDRILIPQPPQTVTILGSVKNPTSVVYRPGLSVDDYLRQTGGLTEQANEKELYIVRANGLAESAYVKIKDVRPGDTIVVPQKLEVKTPQLALWQSIASIVGSVALAAAGIAVIGR